MGKIIVDVEMCKGCGVCVQFCPKKLIRMSEEFNRKGLHYCEFKDTGECTGCTICATMCPDLAIEVYR